MKNAVILIFGCLVSMTGFVFGQAPSGGNFKSQAELATVRIMAGSFDNQRTFRPAQSGSGVIISTNGLIITSRQAVVDRQGNMLPELWAGLVNPNTRGLALNRAYKLKLIKENKQQDLALLQIQTETKRRFPAIRLGTSDTLIYGDYLGVVGFPNARVTTSDCELLGVEENGSWLYIEGSLLKGMSGGTVIDENGSFIGIAVKTVDNQSVPFLDETNSPIGEVILDSVGLIRPVEAIMEFVRQNAQTELPTFNFNQSAGLTVEGAVTSSGGNIPIANATVGILIPTALKRSAEIESEELIGYARTDARGIFKINRKLRPGKYLVKVVCPGFQTVVKEIVLPQPSGRLILEMPPVKR